MWIDTLAGIAGADKAADKLLHRWEKEIPCDEVNRFVLPQVACQGCIMALLKDFDMQLISRYVEPWRLILLAFPVKPISEVYAPQLR